MDKPQRSTLFFTTGASGGHVFPALAVAAEVQKMGLSCHFVVGGSKFNNLVEQAGFTSSKLPASAFADRGLGGKLAGLFKLFLGFYAALQLLHKHRPLAVFGTGGYASVATMLAAWLCGVPTFIHEANVVPGRANRFLARFATHTITTFAETSVYLPYARPVVLGAPLRAAILAVAGQAKKPQKNFQVLVLGGSQGARLLSDVLPEALAILTPAERKDMTVVHQARPEDVTRVQAAYAQLKLKHAVVQSFFTDLPQQYLAADVIVGRSGTGTLLETATVGRAAIYVPHQLADNHQLLNAQVAERAGAAIVLTQPAFTPVAVAAHLRELLQNPAKRQAMAKAALKIAKPDAAVHVAKFMLDQLERK